MSRLRDKIRLGAIGFINTIPIYLPFESTLDVDVYYDTPARLNAMIHRGELDVSPVSSAFYLANQNDLQLLEDLSVSSLGSVESVLFVSKVPLGSELLALEHIAVPDDSATSVQLLNAMLSEEVGQPLESRFEVYDAAHYRQALETQGCALVIGDHALLIHQTDIPENYHVYDLSKWWVTKTGLPFVFAVWVARKDWAQENAEALKTLQAELTESRNTFFESEYWLTQGVQEAQARSGISTERLTHYFKTALDYRLTDAHRQALNQFGSRL